MDEQIGYKLDTHTERLSQWALPIKSSMSVDSEEDDEVTTSLQIIQKREPRPSRPVIPAKWSEQLSYYRSYVSSPSKTQLICMQHVKFNRFLWYYIINVFFKSLPHTYVYVFLASYAAEYHLFLPKMVPITWGFSFAYIFAALCEITLVVDNSIRCLDYFLIGLLDKNPWNRCAKDHFFEPHLNQTVYCYTMDAFRSKVANRTPVYENHYYTLEEHSFHLSQIIFYRDRHKFLQAYFPFCRSTVYTLLVWLVIAACHKQLFKRYIWKVMHCVHYTMSAIYVLSLTHMVVSYLLQTSEVVIPPESFNKLNYILWKVDADVLAESMTAPPVVHILTARSNKEINVSRDSSIIVVSNAINFILRGLISYRVKRHCEYLATVPLIIATFNQHSFYYFWPIYFSSLSYWGEFCSIFFFFINFMSELIPTIITFQCLVEMIVCEWRIAKRVLVSCVLVLFGLALFVFIHYNGIMIIYVYSQGIATLAEVIGIYILYPTGRLIEDITFHHGSPPNALRTLNLLCVPVFYILKFYTMIAALLEVFKVSKKFELIRQLQWLWAPITAPILLGIIYVIYRDKFRRHGKKWFELFCPIRSWGPREYTLRQLRKLYNSRKYIGSQANTTLSRYMISREPKVYRLDIKYDSFSGRSTVTSINPSEMHLSVEKEKKNV